MERERNGDMEEKMLAGGSVFVFKKSDVTLSPTTKIFVLENDLTKKEIGV